MDMDILPVLPHEADPELNARIPLEPPVPELLLASVMLPLLADVSLPDVVLNMPPLVALLRPDFKEIALANPLEPLPVVTIILPPRPLVADPVPIAEQPEFPATLGPELKLSRPLLPLVPPFGVISFMEPLLVAVPSAPSKFNAPPVDVSA